MSSAPSPDAQAPGGSGDQVPREVRAQLTAEFGAFSPAEAARRAGSRGHSPTLAVKRWQAARKIFAVPVAGSDAFLGFCFDETGRPHPVMGKALGVLGSRLAGWELAVWFTTANDRLGGARPVDLLESEPERLLDAARADAARMAEPGA